MAESLQEKQVNTTETAEIDALNQQAWDLRGSDTSQAMTLAKQARDAATQCDYQRGLAHSLHTLGHCYLRIGDYKAARRETSAAQVLFAQLDDHEGQANTLNTSGNIYSSLGEHHTAYEFYLQSLKLRQAIGHTQAEAASWNNIGNVHFHLNEYDNALACHYKSLALKQELEDTLGVAFSLNNIGNVHEKMGAYENALQQYEKSLAIFRTLNNKYGEAGVLSNIGTIYQALGDPQSALEHHHSSLLIEQALGNKYGEAESLLQLGQLYLQYGERPLPVANPAIAANPAFYYLQQALTLVQDLGAKELDYKINRALSQVYEQQGDTAQALRHYQTYHAIEREVLNEERHEHTRQLQIIHQVESSQKEAELQHAQAELYRVKTIELANALAEAERQRQAAEQANQYKTELLSMAAHDLRNPLAAINGYAGLILDLLPEEDRLRHYLERIQDSSQHMKQLVSQLLESATIENGRLTLAVEPINFSQLVMQVCDNLQHMAQNKKQHLHLDLDADCMIEADKARMQQVVENLVGNAIKYSPEGKNIWIDVSKQSAYVRLSVQDEGPGLSVEDLSKMFSKFERLSAQPTGGERSMGLGLFIVKQLTELQGGQVWAESAGLAKGSSFFVRMPLLHK